MQMHSETWNSDKNKDHSHLGKPSVLGCLWHTFPNDCPHVNQCVDFHLATDGGVCRGAALTTPALGHYEQLIISAFPQSCWGGITWAFEKHWLAATTNTLNPLLWNLSFSYSKALKTSVLARTYGPIGSLLGDPQIVSEFNQFPIDNWFYFPISLLLL